MKVLKQVRETIKRFNMLSPGERVVVGVSGGSDSVGLLYVLAELEEYGLKLIVSHLNHGIRAEEGKRDALFVEGFAKRLNLTYEIQNADTPGFKEKSNLSLEEAARILRYRFFKEVMKKHGAQKIATGHTLDDQAETVLMRLIRGSGALGLSGIPPVSEGCIVRPLIETPKSEIEEYLKSNGVGWIEDSTNRAKVFLRNRIRYELVPELEKYNPRVKETLARTGELLRTQEDFIRGRANNWVEYVFKSVGEDELIGKVSNYRAIPGALRFAFLRIAIEKVKGDLRRVSFKHISSVDELLTSDTPSGEVSLPDGFTAAKGYDLFFVTRKSNLEQEFSYTVNSTGKWNFIHAEFEIENVQVESLGNGDEFTAFFDPDSVTFPIEIRSFRGSDRFIPLGMSKFKKIKRFFIDEKVPRFLRKRIPVFLTGGEIMWVGGMRIDERFKVKGKRAVRIRLIRPKWN